MIRILDILAMPVGGIAIYLSALALRFAQQRRRVAAFIAALVEFVILLLDGDLRRNTVLVGAGACFLFAAGAWAVEIRYAYERKHQ